MLRRLERDTWVPRPRSEVFEFFAHPENLEAVTPESMKLHILTPSPIEMREGARIDYDISLGPFRARWRTLIRDWQPPVRFVDEQLRGPYRRWIHEHLFEEHEGGTTIRDRVQFEVPGWVIEPMVYAFFVEPRLREIFDVRAQVIRERFG